METKLEEYEMAAYIAFTTKDSQCYMVIAKDNAGCISSINMFIQNGGSLNTFRSKMETEARDQKTGQTDVIPKYPESLLQSNTVPSDHAQIHTAAGHHIGVPPSATENNLHWHWDVKEPSKANNVRALIYLQAFGLHDTNSTQLASALV